MRSSKWSTLPVGGGTNAFSVEAFRIRRLVRRLGSRDTAGKGNGAMLDTADLHTPRFCYHDVTMEASKVKKLVGMTGFEPATP